MPYSGYGLIELDRRCWMNAFGEQARRGATAVTALLVIACMGGCTTVIPSLTPVDQEALLGTWKVDLRPTPDAEPYYQEFIVSSVQDDSFSGVFYGTAITEGRINTDWGKLRIAFVTVDGSGSYHHSAVLEGVRLEGLTNSTGRGFLAYWSAVKQ